MFYYGKAKSSITKTKTSYTCTFNSTHELEMVKMTLLATKMIEQNYLKLYWAYFRRTRQLLQLTVSVEEYLHE